MHWLGLAVRWTARLLGSLLIGLLLLVAIGEGPPNPFTQPPAVQALLFATVVMLVGFAVGWRREATGAALALSGAAIFYGVEIASNGKPPGGAMPLFAICGVLYLISAIVNPKPRPAARAGNATPAALR